MMWWWRANAVSTQIQKTKHSARGKYLAVIVFVPAVQFRVACRVESMVLRK